MNINQKLHTTLFANRQVQVNSFRVLDDQERIVEVYEANDNYDITKIKDITYLENGYRMVHTNDIESDFESWEYYNKNNRMIHYEDSNSIVKEKEYDENGNLIHVLSINEERETALTVKEVYKSIVRVEEWLEYRENTPIHYKCEIKSISGAKIEILHDYYIKNNRPCYGKIYGKFYFNRPYKPNKGFIRIHSFDRDGEETINTKDFLLDEE